MVREFIAGWDVMQILGEGTFASVKLLVHRETGASCAVKEINYDDWDGDLKDVVKKEICLHKLLNHPNIVRCYGASLENMTRQLIFLEYCSAGELFDRIEPSKGMAEYKAHRFFHQIISAVEYIHERGITHRDIKPENLLLADNDVLKLSDFGFATVFRHNGKDRLLERKCGTRPYIAPEVLTRSHYTAQPADIWSCGIVLLAMLIGELPWDVPIVEQAEFLAWKTKNTNRGFWTRLDSRQLSFLRKILHPIPSKRATIPHMKTQLWFKARFVDDDGQLLEPELVSKPIKRLAPGGELSCLSQQPQDLLPFRNRNPLTPAAATNTKMNSNQMTEAKDFSVSKPTSSKTDDDDPALETKSTEENETDSTENNFIPSFGAYSQPAKMLHSANGSLTQQTQGSESTQGSTQGNQFHRLVKRMTRFWVNTNLKKTDDFILPLLKKLEYKIDPNSKGMYTLTTTDRRGTALVIKCMLIHVDGRVLIDFRMSRGCGLEFKRHFKQIKANCHEIMDRAPILWPALLPLDALPEMGC